MPALRDSTPRLGPLHESICSRCCQIVHASQDWKIGFADHCCDQRRDDVLYERVDDGAKRRADDDCDSKVEDVAARMKSRKPLIMRLELLLEVGFSDGGA